MRRVLLLAGTIAMLAGGVFSAMAAGDRWVVVYSEKPTVEEFRDYGLVVLDSIHHPPIRTRLEHKKTVIGYISLGEVESYRDYFKAVEKEGILYEKNPNWPDSRFVDVRDTRWTKRVLEELIPQLLHKGFLVGALVTFRELGRIPYHAFITQPPPARAAPEDEKNADGARTDAAR
jgi:hypothetical protein